MRQSTWIAVTAALLVGCGQSKSCCRRPNKGGGAPTTDLGAVRRTWDAPAVTPLAGCLDGYRGALAGSAADVTLACGPASASVSRSAQALTMDVDGDAKPDVLGGPRGTLIGGRLVSDVAVTTDGPLHFIDCGADEGRVRDAYYVALAEGLTCLHGGDPQLAAYFVTAASAPAVNIRCRPIADTAPEIGACGLFYNADNPSLPEPVLTIDIDVAKHGEGTRCGELAATLFHELLHAFMPNHDKNLVGDQLFACERLCIAKREADRGCCFDPGWACDQGSRAMSLEVSSSSETWQVGPSGGPAKGTSSLVDWRETRCDWRQDAKTGRWSTTCSDRQSGWQEDNATYQCGPHPTPTDPRAYWFIASTDGIADCTADGVDPGGPRNRAFRTCEGPRQNKLLKTGEWSMCDGATKPAANVGSSVTGTRGAVGHDLDIDVERDGRSGERITTETPPPCPPDRSCSSTRTKVERWRLDAP